MDLFGLGNTQISTDCAQHLPDYACRCEKLVGTRDWGFVSKPVYMVNPCGVHEPWVAHAGKYLMVPNRPALYREAGLFLMRLEGNLVGTGNDGDTPLLCLLAVPVQRPGLITSSFSWALPFPRLLHCPVFLPASAWEFFFAGNQCDNTQPKLQIIKLTSLSLVSS